MQYKKLLTGSLAVLFVLSSCKKQLDINTNPYNPSFEQLTSKLVFPAGVASSIGRIGGNLAILGGMWSQYYTQSVVANQFKNIDSYNLTKSFGNTATGVDWVELYSGALNDLVFVQNKSLQESDWNYYLMSTVVKAFTLQVLVDLYDQVPYSEAFQGTAILQPHFDDGYTVYKGLLAEIDEALAKDFTASSNSSPGRTDLVFPRAAADWVIDPWIQFANTLKLKMYLRMVYAKPAEAEAGIRSLYDNGANFLDVDAFVNVFETGKDKSNPFFSYNNELGVANLRASYTFLSWLQENNDPRIANYYAFASGTTGYTAIHQGDFSNSTPALNVASVGTVAATDPADYISLAESHFLQAEALERFYSGMGAKAEYDAGVTASFKRYGYSASFFLAAAGKYVYPSAGTFEQKLEAIITQKWASMTKCHGLEAFFEKNRTGYPKTSPVYSTDPSYIPGQFVYSKNGVTNGLFPKRLIFPDLETSKNANAPADKPITEKVWWDVR